MIKDIFGLEESSKFARALAASVDVKVIEKRDNVTPYSLANGNIVVGTPSIYNSDDYMGHLHREISKQSKDMKFFHQVDCGEDEMKKLCKAILQGQRTEYHMFGTYQGRDNILSEMYRKDVGKAGGAQAMVDVIAKVNPTAAAMLYIGNEMRNEWQGYNHCECPASIQSEVSRLQPILQDRWLKLNDKASLETLLNEIIIVEEEQQDGSSGNAGEKGDGEAGGGEKSEPSSGEPSQEGEGSGDTGEQEPGSPGSGEAEEPDAGGAGEENGGSSEGNGGSPESEEKGGEGSEGSAGHPDGEDGGQSQGGGGGESKSSEGDKGPQEKATAHNNHGASDAYASLKDIGLIKEPVNLQVEDSPKPEGCAYRPGGNDLETSDLTEGHHSTTVYTREIERALTGFYLSKKVRKYLISQSQVGYELGKKRGKLCAKNVYRLYSAASQPRIFKTKEATKIQTDTAVFILGDCSGSMSNERYITSGSCQVSLSEVLQALQIPHMMMQFSTGGAGRAHYIMKHFSERYVSRDTLISRYGSSRIHMGCNADGEAVTAAAQMLAQRPEKSKLLIVLSDGEPAYGYGNDAQYLKDTVQLIESSKVMDIVGVGIQTRGVRRYYSNSKVVNELSELEGVLLSLLKEKVLR